MISVGKRPPLATIFSCLLDITFIEKINLHEQSDPQVHICNKGQISSFNILTI